MFELASCSLSDRENNGNVDLFDFPLFFPFTWAVSSNFFRAAFLENICRLFLLFSRLFVVC